MIITQWQEEMNTSRQHKKEKLKIIMLREVSYTPPPQKKGSYCMILLTLENANQCTVIED